MHALNAGRIDREGDITGEATAAKTGSGRHAGNIAAAGSCRTPGDFFAIEGDDVTSCGAGGVDLIRVHSPVRELCICNQLRIHINCCRGAVRIGNVEDVITVLDSKDAALVSTTGINDDRVPAGCNCCPTFGRQNDIVTQAVDGANQLIIRDLTFSRALRAEL